MTDLSIIIVNWNSSDYLRKCLESIKRQDCGLQVEVIVVDNASFDGSHDVVQNEFPGTIFVQSQENLGFARANNLGFRHSSGENLLFLNPDTEVLGSAVSNMLSHLRSLPDAGAVGCTLLKADHSLQTDCVQPFPTILNQVIDVEWLKMRFPKVNLWGIKALYSRDGKPAEVEIVSGACIMIKRGVFEKVGMFSTDYFMYAEDADLCYKVYRSGQKIYYVSDSQIVHHQGGSSGRHEISYLNDVLIRESVYRFLAKHRGRLYASLFRVSVAVTSAIRIVLIIPAIWVSGRDGTSSRERPPMIKTFNKWTKVMRWSLGFETWTKEPNGMSPVSK